ncbi:uncharacterized protein [Epargyreus clarus]|uniref:uncharacterized protein isoform X2 n=1 Tax=Epargyreus clarus TaxID=520877 RepID=UPI003C2B59B6
MNQWRVMKISTKKELATYRQEVLKTGGGPKPPSPTPEILEITDMIPHEFTIDTNEYDCDGINDFSTEIIVLEEEDHAIDNTNNKEEQKENISPTFSTVKRPNRKATLSAKIKKVVEGNVHYNNCQ